MRYAYLLALLFAASSASAQSPGTCEPGEAWAELDVNEVRARLFNNGNLFSDEHHFFISHYEVPKGSGIHANSVSRLWVGGLVDGQLRISAADYPSGGRSWEFWPGPLDDAGNPPADCAEYDRLWKVSRTDIELYEQTGMAVPDLAEWPFDLGAPVLDGDGDPANYDLAAGDRPDIRGDQGIWWVMNDAGNEHTTTDSPPLGMEVRVLAFAYDRPDYEHATFYEYTFVYKGQAPLEHAFVTFMTDPRIGMLFDDYIGADTTLGLGLAYNADNNDETHPDGGEGYGAAPPAVGFDFLRGPRATDGTELGLTRFGYYNNNADPTGNPGTAEEHWNVMRGFWRDGECWTFGGDGRGGAECTDFVYPNSGTPEHPEPGYWSAPCANPTCTEHVPSTDQRFVLKSTGPFAMQPGEAQTLLLGIIWARGADNFASIQEVKRLSALYQEAFPVATAPGAVPPPPALRLDPASPNPFCASTALRVYLPAPADVRLGVYDLLGREVARLADGPAEAGTHRFVLDGARLPSGTYLVRLEAGRQHTTRLVTHIE